MRKNPAGLNANAAIITIITVETMPRNHTNRLELSLPNFRHNYGYYRSLLRPSTKLLVLVKANAYGAGAVEMGRLLEDAGADYLAVATVGEGMELRLAGIRTPVLVLNPGTDSFDGIIEYGLEPALPDVESVRILSETLERLEMDSYPVHLALDTGMHRLGFMSNELEALLSCLSRCPRVKVRSVYSHLCVADSPSPDDDEYTLRQLGTFSRNAGIIDGALGYHPLWHVLNTAGIERFPEYQFDMVRLGIGIYGVDPVPGTGRGLLPVSSLKVEVLQVKELAAGDGEIGYGRHGRIAPAGTRIATIRIGYADGINRHLGGGNASFLVNGHRAPTIGSICMDSCMLDVTGIDVRAGDEVTVFGENPSVRELARILDTIPYEIMTSVPRRIPRVIVDK